MTQRVFNLLRRLWASETGSVELISVIVLTVLVTIGVVAGLSTYRAQLIQEMGDIAVGLESLDQSYSFTIVDNNGVVIKTVVFDEDNPPANSPAPFVIAASPEAAGGTPPAGITFVGASGEN